MLYEQVHAEDDGRVCVVADDKGVWRLCCVKCKALWELSSLLPIGALSPKEFKSGVKPNHLIPQVLYDPPLGDSKDAYTGWVYGNNFRQRGRLMKSKGFPDREPWYETEDGKNWS